ncbi:MAG TPA: ABC transporter ATP-binding protein, partial [Verrucomicrobiae bacterium]|nr:ABC transporter ATP-binding protein [Verrucomicrobiae bacterium]
MCGAVLLVLTNGASLAIPWLTKLAVDDFKLPGGHPPSFYGMLIIAAAVVYGVIRIFSRTVMLHAGREIEFRIREQLYATIVTLDLPYFTAGRTGDILSRFSNDLTNVRMLLGFGAMNVVNTVVLYLAALGLMLGINPLLTLWAVLPYPLMIAMVKRVSRRMFRQSQIVQEELAAMTSRIEENVTAQEVIRGYCREEAEAEAFGEANLRYRRQNLRLARIRASIIPIMGCAGGAGTLVVLFMGGRMVISGAITLGDFVAFNGYLVMLIWPTVMVGWILNLLQRGAASMSRLNEVLHARPVIADPANPAPTQEIRGGIAFRSLSFGYGEKQVLRDLTLTLPPGSRTGIVGEVSSGKSTLARLLARLYPVPDGMLFIDGTDINRLPLRLLREAIGFVPQEGFLFSRSVRDNIAVGMEGASDGEIRRAARLAMLEQDVERFPEGYDTLVGERGITLSGGQRQRVALARALLKNPAILVLDDPLSAVDARTGEKIVQNLAEYCRERTVVMVSHRLAPLRDFDRIVYLEGGEVLEQGTHHELVAMGGKYAA